MALRLLEIIVPKASVDAIDRLPSTGDVIDRWDAQLGEDQVSVRMLVDAKHAECILDDLQGQYADADGFRLILLPVEATLPRPEEKEETVGSEAEKSPERISREELYDDVVHSAEISRVFIAQVVIATLVASVGLIRDDTAVIIGAMVIAPLLGPNVALCLATALGDAGLAIRSLKTNLLGLSIALGSSVLIGLAFHIDPNNASIESRTHVSSGDVILALAAGCAGVLAFTTGASSALIGVMVAVALLPPFTAFGLLLAAGDLPRAGGALLLVATNVICINLSGVLTFAAQGLRPRTWWEADRAKKATRIAVLTWTLLLVALLGLIFVAARP